MEKNFKVENIGALAELANKEFNGMKGKYFAGKILGLTSCEVSVNCLPAGQSVPFVHAHKQNEELYIITGGSGSFYVDGEEFPVEEGSLVHVAPEGERVLKAGAEDLRFICVQAKANSLEQAAMDDGIISKAKASWM